MSEIISWILLIIGGILAYLLLVWAGIENTLWLNPKVLDIVEQMPESGWVVAGIVFLAGASTLLGESAVLFINRVRRGRFVISLITNGLVFSDQLCRVGGDGLSGRAHLVLGEPAAQRLYPHGRLEHCAAGLWLLDPHPLDGAGAAAARSPSAPCNTWLACPARSMSSRWAACCPTTPAWTR